jgi:hypothetical protein
MRFTYSLMIVLALAAPVSAAAQNTAREAQNHYATCTCHFGYGSACVAAVACASEGGRCSVSCVLPRASE